MYERLKPDFIAPQKFVLVVGSARSGTTIVGAIIDSHARMICANETAASANFWRGLSGKQILEEIIANSAANYAAGRRSEGYSYAIETDDKESSEIAVIGDKVWNPALLLMAGQPTLLASLEQVMRCSVALVHCVRNPFDVIATMHQRSGASLRDRLRWYRIHCEAIQIIIERDDFPILLVRHEDLIADPFAVSTQISEWLGFPTSEEHLARIRGKVYALPHKSRLTVDWSSEIIQGVVTLTSRFPYLAGYSFVD
jgi:hypothetical protein